MSPAYDVSGWARNWKLNPDLPHRWWGPKCLSYHSPCFLHWNQEQSWDLHQDTLIGRLLIARPNSHPKKMFFDLYLRASNLLFFLTIFCFWLGAQFFSNTQCQSFRLKIVNFFFQLFCHNNYWPLVLLLSIAKCGPWLTGKFYVAGMGHTYVWFEYFCSTYQKKAIDG